MSENIEQVVPAKVRQPRKISPFWLLPLVAFIIGGLLFFQILQEQGEKIKIRFQEGDGISAGKTLIRYQGLQIGQVKKVYFVEQMKLVEVEAEINPEAKSVLKEGTKFWLVKPSASLAGVSGLDALVSGNYITVQPNEDEEADSQYSFIAEEEPPTLNVTDGDLLVHLVAPDLGSIAVGANVYFRKVPVGNIADYRFTPDQKQVEIDLIIEKKYAHLVKQTSRFWNISGLQMEASLSKGINLNLDSIASVIQGAVAFDSPDSESLAEQGQRFALYTNVNAAQRGQEVRIDLPADVQLSVNETAVFHQQVQVGVLTELTAQGEDDTTNALRSGTLLIDPNHIDLLRSQSQIVLKTPKFTPNKAVMSNVGELLKGSYFEIEAGKGEPTFHFKVQKEADYLLSRPNVLALHLTAPQSFGVDQGQAVYYNDVQIGDIVKRNLTPENVHFQAIIYPHYRHLINGESRFVAISRLDVELGLDGLRFQAGSPADWLVGGVRVLSYKSDSAAKQQYPLYKDIESAEHGITDSVKTASVNLTATTLAGIDKGSVVLYRDFPVGEVLNITPKNSGFEVSLFISPKYRHLLSEKSRFWIEAAAKIDLSTQGLSVQASPLMRTLKGAISFEQVTAGGSRILYESYEKAHAGNSYLTFSAQNAAKLTQGMPIKYMGLNVGKLERLQLDNAKKQIKATAYIESQYYALLAKSGSKFKVVSTEIDTSGVKNLEAVLQNYIEVEVGGGQTQTVFPLAETHSSYSQYAHGLPIVLETTDANGISVDAPVFYRGVQVGIVQKLSLSELGDRVFIYVKIENKHKHLVRKNSQFWASSGYTMDISLSGASINSGTMSQLLNGGISFSTPSGKVVQPQAEPDHHFRLERKTPEGALGWDMGVAQ